MADKKAQNLKRTKKYKEIHDDMMKQLADRGMNRGYDTDLVEDYMDLWVTKSLLIEDIHDRGISVEYNNGGGQKGVKKNDSVEQLIKVNAQMLKLRAALGIDAEGVEGDDEGL